MSKAQPYTFWRGFILSRSCHSTEEFFFTNCFGLSAMEGGRFGLVDQKKPNVLIYFCVETVSYFCRTPHNNFQLILTLLIRNRITPFDTHDLSLQYFITNRGCKRILIVFFIWTNFSLAHAFSRSKSNYLSHTGLISLWNMCQIKQLCDEVAPLNLLAGVVAAQSEAHRVNISGPHE